MATEPKEIQDQLSRLPVRHLATLRAALLGLDTENIAALLGIPVGSVPTTLQVAAAKLTTVLAEGSGTESVPPC